MVSLAEALKRCQKVTLAIACVYPGIRDSAFDQEGITYFPISQGYARRLTHFRILDVEERFLDKCLEVAEMWGPDIIHVHGTERPYGLLAQRDDVQVPIVISIQGLLSQCSKWAYAFGNLGIAGIIRMHSLFSVLRGIGPIIDYLHLRKRAQIERRIIRSVSFVLGRTQWDKAHVTCMNPSVKYYHVGELLRPEFSEISWDLNKVKRHTIIFTNARGPRRNIHTLYKAVSLLKKKFPDVSLLLAGGDPHKGYGRFLQGLAKRLNILDSVKFLGYLTSEELAGQLAQAHVFVIPSLIENSPNSLCEAQMVGVPCVASYTGGIPSLVEDGISGLLFDAYDSCMLAYKITEIFRSDEMARSLGEAARKAAFARHNQEKIVTSLLRAYIDAMETFKKGSYGRQ